ncbi:flagellar motor protein MotB [Sphingobium sp.]|uniref:flagellar motor protein MotB n=1 Tax=Sphingobium sp. TaxID=1912891 RepID=UPI003BB5BC44
MSAAVSSPSQHNAARRNRWAISFADLLLLLLAFFVLLQASGSRRDAMLAQVAHQFGGRAMRQGVELHAADLFLPGEALLTTQGQVKLSVVARDLVHERGGVEIVSHGSDRARGRFDDWDLAAARLGAVARALRSDGIGQDKLLIRGLDQADGKGGHGQVIRIAPGSVRAD